jgi:transcriptional regulator with PAS, ATPase and Fis domain
MLESELFGHEAGAFTGAQKRKQGLMEYADEGILFLDEISSMSPNMQAKLLRALEERSFRRVGGKNRIHVDVQILAASNHNIPDLIKEKRFRSDLYFRLRVLSLEIPPLRKRQEDIPALAGHFLKMYNLKYGKNIQHISPTAMKILKTYSWPGNVRELKNIMERAMIFCDDSEIDVQHLSPELKS